MGVQVREMEQNKGFSLNKKKGNKKSMKKKYRMKISHHQIINFHLIPVAMNNKLKPFVFRERVKQR